MTVGHHQGAGVVGGVHQGAQHRYATLYRLQVLVAPRSAKLARLAMNIVEHVTMVENQALYERVGYVETARTTEHGFTRVFYEKRL